MPTAMWSACCDRGARVNRRAQPPLCAAVLPALAFAVACAFALALPAQRALLDRLPPDADTSNHRYLGFGDEFEPWQLPGEGAVHGLARIADSCWIARGECLHCVEWPSRRLLRTVDAPKDLVGLTADERFVYGIAGKNLHVVDALAGQSVRMVPIQSVWPPATIAAHRGALYVTVDRTLMRLDAATGVVWEEFKFDELPQWLASDGQRLWLGNDAQCRPLLGEAATQAAWAGRLWPWSVHSSAAVWMAGRLLLVADSRDSMGASKHCSGLLTPLAEHAMGCVTLKIRTDGGVAPKLQFELGPTPIYEEAALRDALRRLVANPELQVRGPDGQAVPMPLVIEARAGVKVRDVARIWDLAVAAGFPQVQCPEQEAWVRRNPADAKSPPGAKK